MCQSCAAGSTSPAPQGSRALNHLTQVARSLQAPQVKLNQLQDQQLIEPMLQHGHLMSQSSTLELKQHVPTSQVTKLRFCSPNSSGVSGSLVLGQPSKLCFLSSNSPGKHSKSWQSRKPPSMGGKGGSPQPSIQLNPEEGVRWSWECHSSTYATATSVGDSLFTQTLLGVTLAGGADCPLVLHICMLLLSLGSLTVSSWMDSTTQVQPVPDPGLYQGLSRTGFWHGLYSP